MYMVPYVYHSWIVKHIPRTFLLICQFGDKSCCNEVKLALRHHMKYYRLLIYEVTVTNDRE